MCKPLQSLLVLLLLFSLVFSGFSETTYLITETELQILETNSKNQTELIEKQQIKLDELENLLIQLETDLENQKESNEALKKLSTELEKDQAKKIAKTSLIAGVTTGIVSFLCGLFIGLK